MSEVSVEDITQGIANTTFGLVVDGGIIRDRNQLEEIENRVNCHDELVEALEAIQYSVKHGLQFKEAMETVDKALAKAKGEA